ncbi:MAG TPA: YdcF family protein [Acetivibrio sp.]|uniref:YdcF family protein n=1 Tax=Acetivibrio sp. TaxID=1872092 RepID=UPI002D1C2038|nr:YdcF family protein [Acetivibrio sp.]HOM02605.1 YdcF family protein [Acetivibrio sp.]
MEKEKLIQILWDYLRMNHKLAKSDCIIVLGSHDTRVAKRGAEIFLEGFAPLIVFTGGYGKLTKHIWNNTEAEKFARIAMDMGVPEECILIENKSSNTGENILFVKDLIDKSQIKAQKIIAVNKPYMERRTYAAFKKLWPNIDVIVTSPQMELKEYLSDYENGEITEDEVISVMVGDLQRIKVYPEKGFQVHQDIPKEVWDAYLKLIEMGYTKHLC